MLDFLDEITQRSSTPTAPVKPASELRKKPSLPSGLTKSTSNRSLNSAAAAAGGSVQGGAVHGTASTQANTAAGLPRRSTDSARSQRTTLPTSPKSVSAKHASQNTGAGSHVPPVSLSSSVNLPSQQQHEQQRRPFTPPPPVETGAAPLEAQPTNSGGGGWGWSSVWSQASNVMAQASNVVHQARTVAEEQVKTASKALGDSEQAKKWSEGVREYAKSAHLDRLGAEVVHLYIEHD